MILSTFLSLTLVGQVILPGSAVGLEQAQEKASVITVCEITKFDVIIGVGAISYTTIDLKHSAILKGEVKEKKSRVSVSASGHEILPEQGQEYVVFIEPYRNSLTVVKMLPGTPENIEAVKRQIGAGKKP